MKLVTAFLRLVRWPNLVFIALTQLLFYYCFVNPSYNIGVNSTIGIKALVLIIISSIFISAAGYIINDYFDVSIDEVNKPGKLIVDKIIKRRWVIIWHIIISAMGIAIGFYIDFTTSFHWLGFTNFICVMLLFGYSVTLKKKLLAGNILISALTAWVIIIVFLIYYNSFYCANCDKSMFKLFATHFIKMAVLYAAFAFNISLIREVIKDMEDMDGDAKYNCKTMPIVWGIPASKIFTAVWIIVLLGTIIILQFYAIHLGWWWSILYNVATIIAPLIWVLQKLYKAQVAADYHQLSTAVKLIMLAGILSMIFFKFYA